MADVWTHVSCRWSTRPVRVSPSTSWQRRRTQRRDGVEDLLEQVVGDIEDEYDEEPPALSKQRDGSYRVQARISLEQLNRELKLELPEAEDHEYESLGGLLLDRLKRIPRVGEVIKIHGVSFEIASANERRVDEVILRLVRK